MTLLDRKLGALTGAVVGDLLGVTHEFTPAELMPSGPYDIVGGGPFYFAPGRGSDDTDLTLAVARSYAGGQFSEDVMIMELVDWYSRRPADVGNQTRKAIRSLGVGVLPAPDVDAQGNGALMRAAPHAILSDTLGQAMSNAVADTFLTHPSARAAACSAAYTACLWYTLRGDYQSAAEAVYDFDTVPELPPSAQGGHSIHSMQLALWAWSEAAFGKRGYEEVLADVIATGGDTDTNACIAGALVGAVVGESNIPPRSRSKINTPGYREVRAAIIKENINDPADEG